MATVFRPLTTEFLLGGSNKSETPQGVFNKLQEVQNGLNQGCASPVSTSAATGSSVVARLTVPDRKIGLHTESADSSVPAGIDSQISSFMELSTDYLFGEAAVDVNQILDGTEDHLETDDTETESVSNDETTTEAEVPRGGGGRFELRRSTGKGWKQGGGDGADDDLSSSDGEGDLTAFARSSNTARAPISRTARDTNRSKRKRGASKREPLAEEFANKTEFDSAWQKWREDRDQNNRSVKRSRERAKLRKLQEASKKATGRGGRQAADVTSKVEAIFTDARDELEEAKAELALLCKYIRDQDSVTGHEGRRVKRLVTKYTEGDDLEALQK